MMVLPAPGWPFVIVAEAPLCLIALRAGVLPAVWAGLAAQRLLLWQPVLSGKSYLRQLRTRRMIQDAVTGVVGTVNGMISNVVGGTVGAATGLTAAAAGPGAVRA